MSNKVDRESLMKVAHLARIQIKPEEEDKLLKDMGEILSWVNQLNTLDTEGVEPLTHMTEETNVMREDKPMKTISTKDALKNAPNHDNEFFKVPKVLKRNS